MVTLLQKDAARLEKVQRLATRMVEGQRGKTYEQRLCDLNLFSLEGRRSRTDLIETFKVMKGFSGLRPDSLFQVAVDSRTMGHEKKLIKARSKLMARSHFFSNRVVNSLNGLPCGMVDLQTVQSFKGALDRQWYEIFPCSEP